MRNNIDETKFIKERSEICSNRDFIPVDLYKKYDVKRGLRDSNGKGVLTGLTNISRVDGSIPSMGSERLSKDASGSEASILPSS